MLDRIADGRTDLVFVFPMDASAAGFAEEGATLIKWCAYYGDVSAIRYLVSMGVSLSAMGENLDLNGAAFHGHWRLCQFLIENGADANHSQPDTGETPLHAALCKANRPAFELVIRVLLAAGADPNVATIPGVETDCFMRDIRTKGETPLHRAAAFGTVPTIKMLLKAGAKVETKDADGDTPLTWASWHLRSAEVLSLLCYGKHRIHPDAVARSVADRSMGLASGMDWNLLGEPHLP